MKVTARRFVRFVEVNNYKNEIWNFFLQLDGNEEELHALEKLLKYEMSKTHMVDEETYTLDLIIVYSEYMVDKFIEMGRTDGYLPTHSKVMGKLRFEEFKDIEDLYKGGIRNLFYPIN